MKCRNCNKEIEVNEIFCKDCEKELKKVSSKNDVKELEELIENQKKLNDLENTKELDNLDVLVQEELKEIEEQNTEVIELDKKINVKREEIHNKKSKKSNKKTIVIIISIILILIISIITLLLIFKKDEKVVEKNYIDYKKVIKEYGENIEDVVNKYILEHSETPTIDQISELITYDKYDVSCKIQDIYSDGSIYIDSCKVNDAMTKYSYGQKKEEKIGKQIQIYKQDGEFIGFTPTCGTGLSLVGTITCKTQNCEYISAYEKYVLIKEENEYYVYNYEIDNIEFGPFKIDNETLLTNNMLVNNNNLYGVYYEELGINNIYSIKVGKVLKNIKGNILTSDYYFDPSLMYKYNYIPIKNNNKINFINLKTGNISYTIEENIKTFIEDKDNNLAYILTYTADPNKFKIYNSNGKLLFDGKEYVYFLLNKNNILVADNNSFKIYDKDLKLQLTSKKFEKLLSIYDEYIVVIDKGNLKILNYDNKELVVFNNSYNKNSSFDGTISGIFEENNKVVLNIYIKNLNQETIKYYYIPSENKSGFTKI